jgi:uncharacterized membrane protein
MAEISLHNIDQIARDIRNQEITFSHLPEDLIDHVCCDVENEMQNGLNFTEAYLKVKQKMGPRRLKEIQEETLYAVDTKYRYMKNTMKISGVAGTILLGFGSMFKIQHFPGGSILLTLGAAILALVFLPSALGVLWKETHNRNRLFLFISAFFAGIFFISGALLKIQHWPAAGWFLSLAVISCILFFIPALTVSSLADQENKAKRPVYIVGAIGIICYAAGMLSKIQHWPLAGFLMVTGMILSGVIAFPWYSWITWREDSHVSARYIFIMIGSLLIAVPGALINLNLQNIYNTGFFINQKEQQVLFNYKYTNNLSLIDHYRDSSCYKPMNQLHSKTISLLELIGDIQTKMVAESEGKAGNPVLNPSKVNMNESSTLINYDLLSNPFTATAVKDFLFPGCLSRQDINKALEEYNKYLAGLNAGTDIEKYKGLLDPSLLLPGENEKDDSISLLSGLHSLELLKNSILTVETIMLKSIVNN